MDSLIKEYLVDECGYEETSLSDVSVDERGGLFTVKIWRGSYEDHVTIESLELMSWLHERIKKLENKEV